MGLAGAVTRKGMFVSSEYRISSPFFSVIFSLISFPRLKRRIFVVGPGIRIPCGLLTYLGSRCKLSGGSLGRKRTRRISRTTAKGDDRFELFRYGPQQTKAEAGGAKPFLSSAPSCAILLWRGGEAHVQYTRSREL